MKRVSWDVFNKYFKSYVGIPVPRQSTFQGAPCVSWTDKEIKSTQPYPSKEYYKDKEVAVKVLGHKLTKKGLVKAKANDFVYFIMKTHEEVAKARADTRSLLDSYEGRPISMKAQISEAIYRMIN